MSEINMGQSTTNLDDNKMLVVVEPVMKTAVEALSALGKTRRLTIIGKGESCPNAVAVSNILTQKMLKGNSKIEKITVDSEINDDGRMISIIEIVVIKTS
jgi:DNA-binding protein|tara:strand:- start:2333 stop:2632 length:300 start_codon:yes stop_codon:yes gene_type:complete